MIRRRLAGGIAAVVLILSAAGPAGAADGPPPNDSIATPTMIDLPSITTQTTSEATSDPADPTACGALGHSVWFSWTAPTDGAALISTVGSDYDTVLVVGLADGTGGMDVLACNDDAGDLQSTVVFDAAAGTTYLFMVATYGGTEGGYLTLSLDLPPPPPSVGLRINARATFALDGTATISGTLECTGVSGIGLDLLLDQPVGRQSISGWGSWGNACGADASPWSATIAGENGIFLGGPATVTAYVYACNVTGCFEDVVTAAVRLRR
jgi:hypothetical protein